MISASMFITGRCNYNCLYCYRHLDKKDMSFERAKEVIDHLCSSFLTTGEKIKISFAGGEPTLVNWVFDAIRYAKEKGAKVELITNGTTKIKEKEFEILDVISFDIDTLNKDKNLLLGKYTNHVEKIEEKMKLAEKYGVRVKINTVVTKINKDDLEELAYWVKRNQIVYRWKIFQFLPSYGIAKKNRDILQITKTEFFNAVKKVSEIMKDSNQQLFIEDNEYMSSAYISIDQLGNLYVSVSNVDGFDTMTIGKVEDFDFDKFINHSNISSELLMKRIELNKKVFKSA